MEERIREFCDKYIGIENLCNYNSQAITMSYMLGLPVSECEGMYPESDWDYEMLDMYDTIENIVSKIRKERI